MENKCYFCNVIFYFSCTGNTQWAARTLANTLEERLVFMNDDSLKGAPYTLSPNERIGFCFPVHGWRPPVMVRRFISHLEVAGAAGHHCWALCTAGDTVGEAMDIFCSDLSTRGIQVNSTYSLLMPESYVGLPFMDVDTKEREEEKLKKAEEDMKGIINGRGDIHRGPLPWLFSGPIGAYFVHRLVKDQPFRVETDRCIRCGKCVEACPVKNMSGGKGSAPEWLHTGRCLTCFACYHHCPTHAIEFGKRTKHKGQYFFKRRQKQPT